MKKRIIRYYLNETAFRSGCPAYTETIRGDRSFVVSIAQNRIRHSNFQFYDFQEAYWMERACTSPLDGYDFHYFYENPPYTAGAALPNIDVPADKN